ncbi:NAD-dependent epimerase/dehydratase family protein [Patescibacteria group bacterium]|nr:NAD-dependent epimerase/dehydratase family protein [Patescibacteria group bacterium]
MKQEKKYYPKDKKNILITGGAGFIGSHLCDLLVKDHNVICLDNLIEKNNINNIKHLLQNPNFRLLKKDINARIDFEDIPELKEFKINIQGISEIYHLACPTSPKNFDKLRMEILYANAIGTINALEITKKYNAKMIFASSAVVYGSKKDNDLPLKESDFGSVDFVGKKSCYDEGKRFSETAIVTYGQTYGLDVKILRIFRTYGPRQALFDGQMISDFVLQALNNKPLFLYGDANFSTCLCYVDDVVDSIMKITNSAEQGPINIGGDKAYKLVDLANKIIEITGSQSKVEFKDKLEFMRPLGLPDIGLAKTKIAWFPLTSIDVGLKKVIEYIRANKILLQPLVDKYDQE